MNKTKAIILAGGEGKKMWPIRESKLLISFFGEPLIVQTIKALKQAGINHFVVVSRPVDFHQIKTAVAPFRAQIVVQSEPKGLADAALKAAEVIKSNQSILIVNANDVFDPNLVKGIIDKADRNKSEIVVPGLMVKEYFPGGYLVVKQGRLVKIVEKPGEGKEPSSLVKLVVDYFRNSNDCLRFLTKTAGGKNDYETAINQMIKSGMKAEIVEYQGYWGSMKYPWDILKLVQLFFEHKLPKNKPVFLGKGVKIFEGAKINGPAYIGAGTIIGNNALVRQSIIGKNCVVGYSTEIARSYLGDNCWFHSNYVGDSVLAKNVSLGAGAVLANLRLDEGEIISQVGKEKINTRLRKLGAIIGENVRVGVNASIMPGIKIGANCFIGPGAVLESDLAENRFYCVKQKISVGKNKKELKLQARDELRRRLRASPIN